MPYFTGTDLQVPIHCIKIWADIHVENLYTMSISQLLSIYLEAWTPRILQTTGFIDPNTAAIFNQESLKEVNRHLQIDFPFKVFPVAYTGNHYVILTSQINNWLRLTFFTHGEYYWTLQVTSLKPMQTLCNMIKLWRTGLHAYLLK